MQKRDVRSADAARLHALICDYSLRSNSEPEAASSLRSLEQWLQSHKSVLPDIILETSINHKSHLYDALSLPFSDEIQCPEPLRAEKALRLFKTLTTTCREICKAGAMSWSAYAQLFTLDSEKGSSITHLAAHSGSEAIYAACTQELDTLEARGALSKKARSALYKQPLKNSGINIIQTTASTGNAALLEAVAADMKKLLTADELREQLLARSAMGWNLLHAATRPEITNPELITSIIALYKHAFLGEAPSILRELNQQPNSHHPHGIKSQPAWLKALLDKAIAASSGHRSP